MGVTTRPTPPRSHMSCRKLGVVTSIKGANNKSVGSSIEPNFNNFQTFDLDINSSKTTLKKKFIVQMYRSNRLTQLFLYLDILFPIIS